MRRGLLNLAAALSLALLVATMMLWPISRWYTLDACYYSRSIALRQLYVANSTLAVVASTSGTDVISNGHNHWQFSCEHARASADESNIWGFSFERGADGIECSALGLWLFRPKSDSCSLAMASHFYVLAITFAALPLYWSWRRLRQKPDTGSGFRI